jgi:hypothetical protein
MDPIKKEIDTEEKIETTEVENSEVEVDDDSELDRDLEESINSVKAGKALSSKEEAKSEEPEEVPKTEEPSTPPKEAVSEEKEYDFRIPNKGKFESDESYEKRIELLDLVKRRKLAKTSEQRQEISDEIKTAKNQLKTLNGTDRFVNPLNEKTVEETNKPTEDLEEDETLKYDKERLRQLGGATKEDIKEILEKERFASEVKNTLNNFIGRHEELSDEDTREVFFDFVDSNYKWQEKSGKDLMTVLELARESMFKPAESIQDRVLKGANVQEKVNAMQFPGGTIAKTDFSPEMRKDIDELIATGMSETKAIELLSD